MSPKPVFGVEWPFLPFIFGCRSSLDGLFHSLSLTHLTSNDIVQLDESLNGMYFIHVIVLLGYPLLYLKEFDF